MAAREPLNRAKVVTAALALVERHGVEALSMRKLAAELGVEAMSLYNHVKNKDDVLDAIAEVVFADISLPPTTPDWRADAHALADAFREAALAHPRTASLSLTRQLGYPAIPVTEAALGILSRAGYDLERAVHASRALLAYVIGTLLREMGSTSADPDGLRETALAATGLPHVTASAAHLAVCHHESEYRFGLDLLLDALALRAAG
ncbi:TetR/AcrR family transcriptional regulator C-terminal domain-containing protein [Umezawaea sp. Da 62-37]|uniref:TetR/AcrR family transcriptional regulator C-terminal domain-containing protein n=1 Tax=Umezawaea sp. Da 62-37 TaxID=3075927 RepID=UPI0028F6E65F|nr:TetR/AcrR family transcriptional regulator C-terminal domain-containing protein [Umezawaea sp. Da 62-37]WNV87236.1 TetR/AcrR family transcriptional regulator C-terminal domain-containing protein [Umezawaea sp. Da 62-37]